MSLITKIEFIDDPNESSLLKGMNVQLHDHLTDQADWDAEYWDFDADYLKEYQKLIEKIFKRSANGIAFQALWVGEEPTKVIHMTIDEFLKVIENNYIGTKTKYIVQKSA